MNRLTFPVLQLSLSLFAASTAAHAQDSALKDDAAVDQADTLRVSKRDIHGNEAAVLNVCASFVEAQMIYFRSNVSGDGFLAFAPRIRSTPGKRDGLYWVSDSGEDESPSGPGLAAAAITEDSPGPELRPFFGYYFKMLLSQGPEAPGGARDYRIDGRLVTGFALIAWPAEYWRTGVHAFIVNHLGDVYAKDLGPDTSRIAGGVSAFAPDRTWTRVLAGSETR